MNPIIIPLVSFLIALAIGVLLGYFIGYDRHQRQTGETKEKLLVEREKQEREATELKRRLEEDNKKQLQEQRKELEGEFTRRQGRLEKEEERLERRRSEMDARIERLQTTEQNLNKRATNLEKRATEIGELEAQKIVELEKVAALPREEARKQILEQVEKTAREDMARIVREVEAEAREEGEQQARKIIALAMQRIASGEVAESAISVVPIPNDEMKGRIIGRAGRNVRSLEQAVGVDIIVDDTPEAITVSSFDPVRREVARRALLKLIQDGRIHPAQIEKIAKEARNEVDVAIKEAGERAMYEAGVVGLHPELIRLLGRLEFRTSYGQNQNHHAVEAALLAGAIAAELGADVDLAKTSALLHDLGKAVDHEVEGTHAAIGAELARRYGMPPKVINAIAAHHHEVEQETIEAVIVEVADAISGARPGARRESLEQYIKRIRSLEDIGRAFKGVDEVFALQAGREVRLIVRPDKLDDYASQQLARDVAKKIEENMQYPGQVKVTVIREMRSVEYAK
jgi:ribonuclease Y